MPDPRRPPWVVRTERRARERFGDAVVDCAETLFDNREFAADVRRHLDRLEEQE